MKPTRNLLLAFFSLALLLPACGGESQPADMGDTPGVGALPELPEGYQGLDNPLEGDRAAIERGAETYQALCVSCHGEQGRGEGAAGASLDPPPGNLADPERMAALSDGYLFWRIAEGGSFEPFNSMMPSWEALLSEQEIWELVSYIRTLPE